MVVGKRIMRTQASDITVCISGVAIPYEDKTSGDEIANVNCLYDDILYALKIQYSCINSATDRILQRRFTKFSEITPFKVIQDHQSKAHMRLPNFNRLSRAHERYRQTTDRRTADDI